MHNAPSQLPVATALTRATTKYVYTLVSYRANGADYRRNCLMGTSDSDFSLKVFTEAEPLVAAWAQERFACSLVTEREVCSFEFTLLINGYDEHLDPEWGGDPAQCEPDGEPFACGERRRVTALTDARFESLKAAHCAELLRKEANAEVLRLSQQRDSHLALETRERAELARLQSVYASGTNG